MKESEISSSAQLCSTKSSSESGVFKDYPYLGRLNQLSDSYPALQTLVDRLRNNKDIGREKIAQFYARSNVHGGSPGRCAVLTFDDDASAQSTVYHSADELARYLDASQIENASAQGQRRLFVLEDLEPRFVEVLGDRLGVDPLVFSEQMNTWSFTDSRSVPHRALPSMHSPEESFTLRYFEIRTLAHEDSVRTNLYQMTHAINRRRIERWRDVDLPNSDPDFRHAAIRRCASFWTSAPKSSSTDQPGEKREDGGWDAVILVDPPMDMCDSCRKYHSTQLKPARRQRRAEVEWRPTVHCRPSCLMLEDVQVYNDRSAIWNITNWTEPGSVREARHNSSPYHGGGPSLVPPPISPRRKHQDFDKIKQRRNLESLFDEIVFYWAECANPALIKDVQTSPVNSAYYLLKFISQQWTHQLELIGYYVAISEWFADDHDAKVDSHLLDWRKELKAIAAASRDIHHTIRQMSRFDHAVTLNLERLGVQLGCEAPASDLPVALAGAQKDFLALSSRLKPLRQRVDDISGIANDAANLRASLKGIQDGEQGLRLSLFAAIIFPLTFVASMFSMSDGYRPGQTSFWVFWAVSVPFAILLCLLLMYAQVHHFAKVAQKAIVGKMANAHEPRPQPPGNEVV